jgi:hypothetical protein
MPKMSFFNLILIENHMSITLKVSAGAPVNVNAAHERLIIWTPFLIFMAIVACAIAASFYVDAPLVDASLVGS